MCGIATERMSTMKSEVEEIDEMINKGIQELKTYKQVALFLFHTEKSLTAL